MRGITGEYIWDGEILFCLMAVIMTSTGELLTGSALCVSASDVFGREGDDGKGWRQMCWERSRYVSVQFGSD